MALKARSSALIRVSLGLALLFALFYIVDLDQLRAIIVDVDPWWLIGVALFPHLAIMVSVIKWHWLLKAQNLHYPLGTLFRLYLVGTFFSNFLPSMIGGDIVRGYLLGAGKDTAPHVTAAIFTERLSGLAALVCLLVFAVLDTQLRQRYPLIVTLLVLIMAVSGIVAVAIYRKKTIRSGLLLSHPVLHNRVTGFLKRTRKQVGEYRQHVPLLVSCFLLSFPFYFFAMLAVYSAGRAVGVDIELWILMVVVPVVLFIGLLPVSINGMGINETGWIVFLGLYGVSPAPGLAIGLLLRARILLTSAVGGVLYATLKSHIRKEDCGVTEKQS